MSGKIIGCFLCHLLSLGSLDIVGTLRESILILAGPRHAYRDISPKVLRETKFLDALAESFEGIENYR